MLTFEYPPPSTEHVMTKEEIAAELTEQAGEWAVVARPDRWARATGMSERINDGREYGDGFAAVVVKVGAEIRVYARKLPSRENTCPCGREFAKAFGLRVHQRACPAAKS
jgi:hypothetical protein